MKKNHNLPGRVRNIGCGCAGCLRTGLVPICIYPWSIPFPRQFPKPEPTPPREGKVFTRGAKFRHR